MFGCFFWACRVASHLMVAASGGHCGSPNAAHRQSLATAQVSHEYVDALPHALTIVSTLHIFAFSHITNGSESE